MRLVFKLVVLSALTYAGVKLLLTTQGESSPQNDRNDGQARRETLANSYYASYDLWG